MAKLDLDPLGHTTPPIPVAAEADADLDLDLDLGLGEQAFAVLLGFVGQRGQPLGRRPEQGLLHGLGWQRQLDEVANEHADRLRRG